MIEMREKRRREIEGVKECMRKRERERGGYAEVMPLFLAIF